MNEELKKLWKEERKIKNQIALKKAELSQGDYISVKYIEGDSSITTTQWQEHKASRLKLRSEINELEEQLKTITNKALELHKQV